MVWRVLGLASFAAMIGAAGALVAALLARWPLARRFARGSTLVALGCLISSVALVVISVSAPGTMVPIYDESVDPSQRARVLAQSISETLNGGAFAFVATLIGAGIWVVAARRLRRAG